LNQSEEVISSKQTEIDNLNEKIITLSQTNQTDALEAQLEDARSQILQFKDIISDAEAKHTKLVVKYEKL
jgi:hypothetical protein